MADPPRFESPIHQRSAPTGSLTLTDESAVSKMSIRAAADSDSPAALGGTLMGRSRIGDRTLIAGIRPGEWWIIGEPDAVAAEVETLDLPRFAHTIDLTHGRLCLRLTGPDASRALEKVCSLDFSDPMTPDGAAVSASVANVSCDLIRHDHDGQPSYLILADRSYGQYLYDALADAATEF